MIAVRERFHHSFALTDRAIIAFQPEGKVGTSFQYFWPYRMREYVPKIALLKKCQNSFNARVLNFGETFTDCRDESMMLVLQSLDDFLFFLFICCMGKLLSLLLRIGNSKNIFRVTPKQVGSNVDAFLGCLWKKKCFGCAFFAF